MLRTVGGWIIVLVLLPWGQASAEEAIVGKMLGAGVHAYFAHDPARALECLNAAIEAGTHDPRAYYFRGLAQLRLGASDQAKEDFQIGAQLESTNTNTAFNVPRALERVQGADRLMLEQYRAQGRLMAAQLQEARDEDRYKKQRQDQQSLVQPVAPAIPVDKDPTAAFQSGPVGEPTPAAAPAAAPAEAPAEAPAAAAATPKAAEKAPAPVAKAAAPAKKPATPAKAPAATAKAAAPKAEADDPFATPAAAPAAKADDKPADADAMSAPADAMADQPAADGAKPAPAADDPFAAPATAKPAAAKPAAKAAEADDPFGAGDAGAAKPASKPAAKLPSLPAKKAADAADPFGGPAPSAPPAKPSNPF